MKTARKPVKGQRGKTTKSPTVARPALVMTLVFTDTDKYERLMMRQKMTVVCETDPRWELLGNDEKIVTIRKMERSCYNKAIDYAEGEGIPRAFTNELFRAKYSSCCSHIISNLDRNGSVHSGNNYCSLLARINDGEVDAGKVAILSSEELCPEASEKTREELNERKAVVPEKNVSRMHVCGKCKGDETSVMVYQGRGGDECLMVSIECVKCGHIWHKN